MKRTSMQRAGFRALLAGLVFAAPAFLHAITLVRDGQAQAVIVYPTGADSSSAKELASYINRATGAVMAVVPEDRFHRSPAEGSAVFVGPCQAAKAVVEGAKLQPEGFVIRTSGRDVFIVGRDETEAGLAVHGTYYGVCEFLERFVGVRWLLPGPLGEVVPKSATIDLPVTDIRQEPILLQRKIRPVRTTRHRDLVLPILKQWDVSSAVWEQRFSRAATTPWMQHQRLGARLDLQFGHSFAGWWDKYHEQYPQIFALQPNGTRINTNVRERLCVSNPDLWRLVAEDRIAKLRANPALQGVSIAPNDGGHNKFCSCEQCRAWDPPEAQAMYRANPKTNMGPGGEGPFPPLSDRYFRFFNEVARRVKAAVPGAYVGTYAYTFYRSPPQTIDRLEDNLIVGYVGPNSMVNDDMRAAAHREILAWGEKTKLIMLRPNLLAAGFGLPFIYVHHLGDDMRFLADHGVRLTDFASCLGNWGSQGLDYYVLAKLLWDPYLDVDVVVADYCRAAYGPGAAGALEYYRRAEALTVRVAATSPDRLENHTTTDLFTAEEIANLEAPLQVAQTAIGDRDPAAGARLQLLTTAVEYARQTHDLISAAEAARAGRLPRSEFAAIEKRVNAFYASEALGWSVAPEQNITRMKRALSLNPGRVPVPDDDDL